MKCKVSQQASIAHFSLQNPGICYDKDGFLLKILNNQQQGFVCYKHQTTIKEGYKVSPKTQGNHLPRFTRE